MAVRLGMIVQLEIISLWVAAASSVSRSSGNRLSEGAASAVLSADGAGYFEVSDANGRQAQKVPVCAAPCNEYTQEIGPSTEMVCMDDAGACGVDGCSASGMCIQTFADECPEQCSQWENGASAQSLTVCQEKDDANGFKCSGSKTCSKSQIQCKQKKVEECLLFCEGYQTIGNHEVNQDSSIVCQSLDANSEQMATCLPLPCSITHHQKESYRTAKVCKQAYASCKNPCADGSDVPNGGSVCYNEWSGRCENHAVCPSHLVRCLPTKVTQNLKNIDKEKPSWGLVETTSKASSTSGTASAALTQAEWSAKQQKDRLEQFRKQMQMDSKKGIMRRDSSESAI